MVRDVLCWYIKKKSINKYTSLSFLMNGVALHSRVGPQGQGDRDTLTADNPAVVHDTSDEGDEDGGGGAKNDKNGWFSKPS